VSVFAFLTWKCVAIAFAGVASRELRILLQMRMKWRRNANSSLRRKNIRTMRTRLGLLPQWHQEPRLCGMDNTQQVPLTITTGNRELVGDHAYGSSMRLGAAWRLRLTRMAGCLTVCAGHGPCPSGFRRRAGRVAQSRWSCHYMMIHCMKLHAIHDCMHVKPCNSLRLYSASM
jgi:hypothetical protein